MKTVEVEHVSEVELAERTPTMRSTTQSAALAHMAHVVSHPRRVSDNAREGIAKERKMSFASGCRMYPRAILWSVILSCTIIMIAYDKMLVGGQYGGPAFQRQFGDPVPGKENAYELSAAWQAGIGNSATVMETFSLLLNGYLTDKYGYKKVVIAALVMINCTVFVTFFSTTKGMLLASQLLCGIPWGMFQTLSGE